MNAIITDERVLKLLDFGGVEAALVLAFTDLAVGKAAVLPRQRIDCGSVKLSTMGGIWVAQQVAGVKNYPTVDGKFNFALTMFDLLSSTPPLVIVGGELTRFRTAAIATMVARRLINPVFRKLTIFGFGVQGRSVAEAMCSALKPEALSIVDPVTTRAAVSEFGSKFCVNAHLETAERAVRGADVVVTATRSKTPVFDGNWLSPGCSVIALGTSLPNGSELDEAALRRCDRLLVEWKPQSLAESGEVALARALGLLDSITVLDFEELFATQQAWRRDADEIILFKSVGIGLSDVATAWLLKRRLAGENKPHIGANESV